MCRVGVQCGSFTSLSPYSCSAVLLKLTGGGGSTGQTSTFGLGIQVMAAAATRPPPLTLGGKKYARSRTITSAMAVNNGTLTCLNETMATTSKRADRKIFINIPLVNEA